jgi:hypothetical protein
MRLFASWRQRWADKRALRRARKAYQRELPDTWGIRRRERKASGAYVHEGYAKKSYLASIGLSYEQYLGTAGWHERRRPAVERANGRCENCDGALEAGRTDVHHLTYGTLGREPPEHLMVLCRKCHQVHHGYPPDPQGEAAQAYFELLFQQLSRRARGADG